MPPEPSGTLIVRARAESAIGGRSVHDFEQLSFSREIEHLLHGRGGIHQARYTVACASQVADSDQSPQAGAIDECGFRQIDFNIRVPEPGGASRLPKQIWNWRQSSPHIPRLSKFFLLARCSPTGSQKQAVPGRIGGWAMSSKGLHSITYLQTNVMTDRPACRIALLFMLNTGRGNRARAMT